MLGYRTSPIDGGEGVPTKLIDCIEYELCVRCTEVAQGWPLDFDPEDEPLAWVKMDEVEGWSLASDPLTNEDGSYRTVDFTSRRCEGCGCRLAGDRYIFGLFRTHEMPEAPPTLLASLLCEHETDSFCVLEDWVKTQSSRDGEAWKALENAVFCHRDRLDDLAWEAA